MSAELTLYYSPGACSLAPHIALEESGLAFRTERVLLVKGEHLRPEFTELNPKTRVPVLVREGEVLTEAVAILLWIAEAAPAARLLPAEAWRRAQAYEWLAWLNNTVHAEYFASVFRPGRFLPDAALHPPLKAHGLDKITAAFAQIDQRLAGREHPLDSGFSLVDCYLFVLYRWGKRVGLPMHESYVHHAALVERLLDRPAVQRALVTEGLEPAEFR